MKQLLIPLTWSGLQLWGGGCKNSVNCEEQMFEKYHCGFTQGRHVKGEMNCERGSAYQPKPSPQPVCFFNPPSASFWGDYDTHHIFPSHLPTSYSLLITMQCAHWYSNCALGYDLINGIWLLAWILEMCLVFWNTKDGRDGGKKGPWEAKNVGERRHRPTN